MIKFAGSCLLLQMGVSLGNTHAGLMQIKSLAKSGASSRKATLAEFEKFAEQVARRYTQDPDAPTVEPNQKGLDQEVRNAIGIIVEYIDQMYGELLSYHVDDQNEAKCPGADACFDEHFTEETITTINGLKEKRQTDRSDHLECRNHLKSSCVDYPYPDGSDWRNPEIAAELGSLLQTSEASASRSGKSIDHCNSDYCKNMVDAELDYCTVYDNYRKSAENVVPDCMGSADGEDFSSSFIEANEGDDNLESMETCLETTRTEWFDPLWDHYLKCQCRRCMCVELPGQCKDKQETFEVGYCASENLRTLKCNAFHTCWNKHVADCMPDGKVCQQIETNVIGRKADNETGERIRCLLKVLNDTTDLRVDALMACKDDTYPTDDWDITCPDGLSCDRAPPVSCTAQPLPCEDATFLQQEYRDNGLQAPFVEERGNFEKQVGECKDCNLVEPWLPRQCPQSGVS